MTRRKYYHAYDDRYHQVHSLNLRWFDELPSAIVSDVIQEFGIQKDHKLLEIGCGEGRDAIALLKRGFRLLATDVSPNAISFCQDKLPDHQNSFQIVDCTTDCLPESFDFIYAIAVVHMLVLDSDRDAFYQFIYKHLNEKGIALICSMGDGNIQRQSDVNNAFDLQERIHESSGSVVKIASTSCRMVNFQTFHTEMNRNHLTVIRSGITSIEPDFPEMMYAVVRKER